MNVATEQRGDFLVVSPAGRLDTNTAAAFEAELMKLAGDSANIVMDMSGLDFVSSAGLRVILLLAKKNRAAKGKLRFAALQDAVEEVFTMSGFSSMFSFFPSVEEALAG